MYENMTSTDGFRIIGSTSTTINFGMAVDYVGDFNNDGWNDLMISAMSITTQGIVYIVLGRPVEKLNEDVIIENALSSSVFVITTPPFSFAGLSLAGIGDLNNDGFADIAIGSIAYQGGYSTQRTYIIYGRRSFDKGGNTLDINEMIVGKDGFTVIGGGFLVAGIGDANQDGIADCMISSYYNWQSKGNAYLMNYPRNINSSPIYLPSSLPSSLPYTSPSSVPSGTATTYTPSNHPSVSITSPPVKTLPVNESAFPSYASTAKPTKTTNNPTVKKTSVPSLRPTTAIPSLRPTTFSSVCLTQHPILNPSYKPSVPETTKPSYLPTLEPTSNQTCSVGGSPFDFIVYDKPGEHTDANNKNLVFVISAPGEYHIVLRTPEPRSKNNENEEKDVKVLSLVPVYNQIIVDGFDALTDIIDLRKYPTIRSFEDLSYSTNPLIIKLPASLQPLFSISSSFSGSSVSSQDKLSSVSESSPSVQEQTITFSSFTNMNLYSGRNFRFVPRTVPRNRVGPNNLSLLQCENEAIKPDEQTSLVHWSSGSSSKSSSVVTSLKSQLSADNYSNLFIFYMRTLKQAHGKYFDLQRLSNQIIRCKLNFIKNKKKITTLHFPQSFKTFIFFVYTLHSPFKFINIYRKFILSPYEFAEWQQY
jgi:hypothetical protein